MTPRAIKSDTTITDTRQRQLQRQRQQRCDAMTERRKEERRREEKRRKEMGYDTKEVGWASAKRRLTCGVA